MLSFLTLQFFKKNEVATPPIPAIQSQQSTFEIVKKVDQSFIQYWQEQSTIPARKVTTMQVVRRISLALTGSIPSLEELRRLETIPEDKQISTHLEHILQSQRFHAYMAERFARFTVGVDAGPFLVYRRRRYVHWLEEQFAANTPIDTLVYRLITAEGIWTTNPAVNFLTATIDPNNDKEGPDEVKLAARTSRAFLGLRLDCMQCHNDKLNRQWKQKDFHELASFYTDAEATVHGIRDKDKDYQVKLNRAKEKAIIHAKVPLSEELSQKQGSERERLAKWVTHPQNPHFSRVMVNRVWAFLFGQAIVQPIDDIPLQGPYPPGFEILANDFSKNNFNLKRLIRILVSTRLFSLDSRNENTKRDTSYTHYPLTRLRPEQVAGSLVQASSLKTLDASSHILVQQIRNTQLNDFIFRYGDFGEDEFTLRGGTIPQRLLLMNGNIVKERLKDNIFFNASTQISSTKDDDKAIESAFLASLTRHPSKEEKFYFKKELIGPHSANKRRQIFEDLHWSLLNSTEFSWNH